MRMYSFYIYTDATKIVERNSVELSLNSLQEMVWYRFPS